MVNTLHSTSEYLQRYRNVCIPREVHFHAQSDPMHVLVIAKEYQTRRVVMRIADQYNLLDVKSPYSCICTPKKQQYTSECHPRTTINHAYGCVTTLLQYRSHSDVRDLQHILSNLLTPMEHCVTYTIAYEKRTRLQYPWPIAFSTRFHHPAIHPRDIKGPIQN